MGRLHLEEKYVNRPRMKSKILLAVGSGSEKARGTELRKNKTELQKGNLSW